MADLACVNRVWLTDLSRELAQKGISAQLDGFDSKGKFFPKAASVLPSVFFQKRDVLSKNLSEELIGAYDLVHVQAWMTDEVSADTGHLLRIVLRMLKPGGWLQWEAIIADHDVEPATPSLNTSTNESRIRRFGSGVSSEYQEKLLLLGFKDVDMTMTDKRQHHYGKLGWLASLEEIHLTDSWLECAEKASKDKASAYWKPHFSEHYAEKLARAVRREALHVDSVCGGAMISAVGRKPI